VKWYVAFKEKKHCCCPPGWYWVATQTVVVADNKDDIYPKLKKNRYAVEIQKITPHE